MTDAVVIGIELNWHIHTHTHIPHSHLMRGHLVLGDHRRAHAEHCQRHTGNRVQKYRLLDDIVIAWCCWRSPFAHQLMLSAQMLLRRVAAPCQRRRLWWRFPTLCVARMRNRIIGDSHGNRRCISGGAARAVRV